MENRHIFFLKNLSLIESFIEEKFKCHINSNGIQISQYKDAFLGGGYLLDTILNFLGHSDSYYGDIDLFYFSDKTNQSALDLYSDLSKDQDFIIHSYFSKKTNFIKIMDARIQSSSWFLKYFDLNCVRIVYDVKKRKLFFDEHFLYFLKTFEILILKYDNYQYFRSYDRALTKKNNLSLFFNTSLNQKNYLIFLKAQKVNHINQIRFIKNHSFLCKKEYKNFLFLKGDKSTGFLLNFPVSLSQELEQDLLKKPELISYLNLLNENQINNLTKFCQKINHPNKLDTIIKIIQNNKKFFSKSISEFAWNRIELFFNLENPYFAYIQDLVDRSLVDISIMQLSNSVDLLLKYKDYLQIFEDSEIVDFIYKDKREMDLIAKQKIINYMLILQEKLYIPINENIKNVKMLVSIDDIRTIGLKFKNCIIDNEFSMINSLNTRIFFINNVDGESLVRFMYCNNEWTVKDFEAAKKEKPPQSHYLIVATLLNEINNWQRSINKGNI